MTKIYLKHNQKKKKECNKGRYCWYCFVWGAPFITKIKIKINALVLKKQRSALDDFSSTNLQLNY